MNKEIHILSSREIDTTKWDACINENSNGLIYSRSVFLDYMCKSWQAVVFGDYEAVMPLFICKKYGIKYIRRPGFSQQSGITGTHTEAKNILQIIGRLCRYGSINFNFSNRQYVQDFTERTNLILPLNQAYHQLFKAYKYNLKSDLIKAEKHGLRSVVCDVEEALGAYEKYLATKNIFIAGDCNNLLELCRDRRFQENYFAIKVIGASGEKLASGLFLKDNKRIYNMATTTFKAGKSKSAAHFLLNEVIRMFAGSGLIFDFEGSELPGVRNFYLKFSPQNQPYFHYHFNRLPFPASLLKQ